MAGKKTKQTEATPEVLELNYQLAELPSSQHRAGLAGLVLMVDWLKRQPNKQGICEIERTAHNATLRINQQGLEDLFNEVYAASLEEQVSTRLREKSRTKEIIPPLREEKRQQLDPKTGKSKEKTIYIYEDPIPKGAFLLRNDPSADGKNGLWIKLWRDVIWNIFRGKPATRRPFADRAKGAQPDDTGEVWEDLIRPWEHTVKLPSTYFIGAQEINAEDVPFRDRARYQFLLRFWPFTVQIYVPLVLNNKDELEFPGYVLAIPDVANLEVFCEEFPVVLRNRSPEPFRPRPYRPSDCVVDLAIEGALDTLKRLKDRLTELSGELSISDLVLGIDVAHVEKQGNNIRLLGSTRLDPEAAMIDEYAQFRNSLWNPLFRKQRLLNLVNLRDWHMGFDRLMCCLPYKQTIGNATFRRDARKSFPAEEETMNGENAPDVTTTDAPPSKEVLVYRIVGVYLSSKLKSKYDLEWKQEWRSVKDPKNKPDGMKDYQEKREKLAREAFFAIRSRTGQDFIDYFASTLCSVPQRRDERSYVALTEALLNNTDEIRALTMLALSARS